MINLRDNYWVVEVPEGAAGHDVNQYRGGSELNYWMIEKDEQTLIVKDLPPGNWKIVCTSKEATEEQLQEVIPEMIVGERYQNYGGDYPVWYHSRRESLRSLLTSK